MNQLFFQKTWILSIGIAVITVGLILLLALKRGDERLPEAFNSYQQGEEAKSIDERKKAFNHALDLYLNLENEYHPRFGNGKLYYNIANSYFQLGQYSWAILYYERALQLMPREGKAWRNLVLARDKLELPPSSLSNPWANLFFLHSYLSLPERLQLFCLMSLITLFLGSACIWSKNPWFKRLAILSLVGLALLLASLGYSRYLSPLEGVLVRSYHLRRDAGEQYAKADTQPMPAGSKVEVIASEREGAWFKILTPSGKLGYVPQESIRLIGP